MSRIGGNGAAGHAPYPQFWKLPLRFLENHFFLEFENIINSTMANRSKDWLNQAIRDLEQSEDSRQSDRHEWACFAAQQAAEKAVIALHLYYGQEGWGHVVARLLSELPEEVNLPDDMIDKGRVLDNFYIPTRYANGHPEGSPFEHYGSIQSEQAIRYASEITEFVRIQMT